MRHRPLVLAAVLLVSAFAGCGGPARGGHSPASGSPAGIARTYVEAIDARDGARLCGVLAPYIAGRFDMATRDPDQPTGYHGCGPFLSHFVGYVEDCCPPEFVHARVLELGEPRREHGLTRVDATIALETKQEERHSTRRIHDVIWLAPFGGRLRVAKLSDVANSASLLPFWHGSDAEDPLPPPDVPAELRSYAAAREEFERRARDRAASYARVGGAASCAGGVEMRDASGDARDYASRVGRGRPPRTPRADIRSVTVRSGAHGMCVAFRTAGRMAGPIKAEFQVRSVDGPSPGEPRFMQGFDVEVHGDGTARVSGGEDDERHTVTVPARVGAGGDTLTLELDDRSFARARPSPMSTGPRPPADRFRFLASVTVPVGGGRLLHDDLGPVRGGPYPYEYPSGRRVRPY